MIQSVYLTETLQREVEVDAETEEEAVEKLEELYNEGEIVLDYSDLIDTEYSNCKISKPCLQIMNQVSRFCEKECSSRECCPEDECVLFRIEKICEDGYYIE